MTLGLGMDAFAVSRTERALREGDPGLLHSLFATRSITHCSQQPCAAARGVES